ncbi:hypothetical protein ACFYV7_39140 [Nocardia suismassiliense]|uniref:Uncharacterized protein n=1 Tax=Nocardia suismassiliense TaxID=2077092 RepID=A0ABW6R6Z7_9NOCA
MKRYVAAWVAIDECQSKRDRDVESYEQQIQQVRTRADEELAGYRAEQAAAAVALREEGQSDDDVAELLEITPRQARQLIAAARSADHESGSSDRRGHPVPDKEFTVRTTVERSSGSPGDTEPTPGPSATH